MSESADYDQEAGYDALLDELVRDEFFLEEVLEEVSFRSIQSYLGRYGDAIESRVNECINQSQDLCEKEYFGPSIVLSTTAIEIIIRFLLLKPFVKGAFLSDEIAEMFSKRIVTGRTSEDREYLPKVLRLWGMDINTLKLANGEGLWEGFLSKVRKIRDSFVHKGDKVDKNDALRGIECAKVLLDSVVHPIAVKTGFTLEVTGKWCIIKATKEEKTFEQSTPFK